MDKLVVYKNKGETLKCHFNIDGAEIKNTFVRLCLEFDNNKNLFFYGNLQENGDCVIEIPKLKEAEGKNGKLIIEAIADSVYFKLYEVDVELKNSVEVSIDPPAATKEASQPAIQLEDIKIKKETKKPITEAKEVKKPVEAKKPKSIKVKMVEAPKEDEWQPLKENISPPTYNRSTTPKQEPKTSGKFTSLQDYIKKKAEN